MTYAQQQVTTLDPWQETTTFIDNDNRTSPLPSFAINKRYYVHTDFPIQNANSERILYVSDQQTDGSLGPWRIATGDHGGGPHGYTAITAANNVYHFRNGHIAQYIIDSSGNVSEIKLLESGQETSFGGNNYVWDTALFVPFDIKKFIFHFGGYSLPSDGWKNDIYRAEVPINQGASFTKVGNTPLGSDKKPYKAAFFKVDSDLGYIYLGDRISGSIYKTTVDKDGNLGTWTNAGIAPSGGNNLGDMFIVDNQLFIIRGNKVYQATIATDGTLGVWMDTPADLPANQVSIEWTDGHPEGKNYAIIGDYVYVTGPDRVYFTKINRPGSSTPTLTSTPPQNTSTPQPTGTTPTTGITPSGKPGDADGNNLVNILDFNILKGQFNQTGQNLSADFNNDSKVNLLDFEILRFNFNK